MKFFPFKKKKEIPDSKTEFTKEELQGFSESTFILSPYENACLDAFQRDHRHSEVNKGAIGGHISVDFTITSIGCIPSVRCSICGKEQNIADYSKF